jgi:hypothetical protein
VLTCYLASCDSVFRQNHGSSLSFSFSVVRAQPLQWHCSTSTGHVCAQYPTIIGLLSLNGAEKTHRRRRKPQTLNSADLLDVSSITVTICYRRSMVCTFRRISTPDMQRLPNANFPTYDAILYNSKPHTADVSHWQLGSCFNLKPYQEMIEKTCCLRSLVGRARRRKFFL